MFVMSHKQQKNESTKKWISGDRVILNQNYHYIHLIKEMHVHESYFKPSDKWIISSMDTQSVSQTTVVRK